MSELIGGTTARQTETLAMLKNIWPQLTPGEPASYRIEVEGSLDEKWSGRLSGMQIDTASRADQKSVTTLTGAVRDQAALMGVLNSLYQLHMTILSVRCESGTQGHVEP